MPSFLHLTTEMCQGLEPRMFAINHGAKEKLMPQIAQFLDPLDAGTFHVWNCKKEKSTELHYHDHDEYWLWSKGRTSLKLRLPDGRMDEFVIGPGWIVYCVRGMEHGHRPLEDWGCFECIGLVREGARTGHLLTFN